MQAGLVTGTREISLVELPDPQPSPGCAVVEIAYCGICGTDLHAWARGDGSHPSVCGHEWLGTVSAIRPTPGVEIKEGDRVGIGTSTACGRCGPCRRGDAARCEAAFARTTGRDPLAPAHGGFAPAIAIDAERLYSLDAALSDEDAAILEPVTIAVHAVRRTPIRLGDAVAVLGGGPIGLLVAQCARAAGAGSVILIEPQPVRRELAGTLGIDLCIDPAEEDPAAAIHRHTGNTGADVVFECAGIPQTIGQSVALARRGGIVSLVGVPDMPSEIHGAQWLVQEIQLMTSIGYVREDFMIAQGLVLDGRVQTTPLHTSTVTLDDLQSAFEQLSGNPEQVKILVDPRR